MDKNQTNEPTTCGDVLDRFPCARCGATTPNECTRSMKERIAAADAINTKTARDAAKGGA